MRQNLLITFTAATLFLAMTAFAGQGEESKGAESSPLLSPDIFDEPGGGGGTGGGGTGGSTAEYRIEVAVYEIGRHQLTRFSAGQFKIRGWTKFERRFGTGSWSKIDADRIDVTCLGSGINDQDAENNAGFVDVEDWSGAIVAPGVYPVTCFHNATHNGLTYSAVSSTQIFFSTPDF